MTTKSVIEDLRNLMKVQSCVQMMVFGNVGLSTELTDAFGRELKVED
jgi:hypothetical protein